MDFPHPQSTRMLTFSIPDPAEHLQMAAQRQRSLHAGPGRDMLASGKAHHLWQKLRGSNRSRCYLDCRSDFVSAWNAPMVILGPGGVKPRHMLASCVSGHWPYLWQEPSCLRIFEAFTNANRQVGLNTLVGSIMHVAHIL